MSSSKEFWPGKRLCGTCLCVWGPEPHTPPPHSLTHCIRVYVYAVQYIVYLFTQGGGGGRVEPERTLEGQQLSKLGQKYQLVYLQSLNSDKHLPQSPFTGQFFRWRHFAFVSYSALRSCMGTPPPSYTSLQVLNSISMVYRSGMGGSCFL
jgi:hypothetical protein